MRLDKKTAIVTGGAAGIRKATVKRVKALSGNELRGDRNDFEHPNRRREEPPLPRSQNLG